MGILKLLADLILGLFFDSPDEYNVTSNKFSVKRTVVFMLFFFSVFTNVFLLLGFFEIGGKYLDLRAEMAKTKIHTKVSSDSQNTPKK